MMDISSSVGFWIVAKMIISHAFIGCEKFANELEHCLFEFYFLLLSNQFLSPSPSVNNYNYIN